MANKKSYRSKAIYTGRRIKNGKIFHCFELVGGGQMLFRGVVGACMGYTYRCTRSSIPRRPEMTDDSMKLDPAWDAEDALVDAWSAEQRAKRKIRDTARPAFKAALDALVPMCRGLGHFERKALVEHLVNLAFKKTLKPKV